ncbi:hypothetical protein AAGG49_22760, partial [Stenotrophomonas maltophilia]|uniref:hypothetical protein n=1 Tax=Stenotrophomonas maltophilia TaxID=40324 RepID=UPI00313D1949
VFFLGVVLGGVFLFFLFLFLYYFIYFFVFCVWGGGLFLWGGVWVIVFLVVPRPVFLVCLLGGGGAACVFLRA